MYGKISFIMRSFFNLLAVNLGLYVISFFFVARYYSVGLPYYDSVGSYVNMFSIANTTRQLGIAAGISQASQYSLSWVQSFFAVITANILPNRPEFMILLNFFLLLLAQYAIFICLKNSGFGNNKAYFSSFLPILPGMAFGWAGGYIDMRRDSILLTLLIADFFLIFDYMHKSNVKKGLMIGCMLGITQWSRGNSLPYLLCVIFPCILIYAKKSVQEKKVLEFMRKIAIPVFISIIISLPFYILSWQNIYNKYVFGSWGIGVERFKAIYLFFRSIPIMILGPESSVLGINSFFLLVLTVGLLFLFIKKVIFWEKKWYTLRLAKELLLSGILIITGMLLLNAVILGVGGYLFPNFPVLVGIFSILVFLLGGLKLNNKKEIFKKFAPFSVIVWTLSIFLLSAVRIYISMPPEQKVLREQTIKTAFDLAPLLKGTPVSYMWLDHINVHDLSFYITQNGGIPISASSGLSPDADTEMPPNQSKSITQQQKEYALAMRTRDYIIVTEDTDGYNNPKGFFFILLHGKPMIEELLKDPNWEKIYTFTDGTRKYQLLKNQITELYPSRI